MDIIRTTIYDIGKNVLLDKIDYGENFLILYHKTNHHKNIFQNFMRQMSDNAILVYIAHKTNQLNFDSKVRNFYFNIIDENVIQDLKFKLDKYFEEIGEKNNEMLLIADWSKANLNGNELFISFLENLIKRSQQSTPGWKRKFRGIRQKTPVTLINAFEITNLNDTFIEQIIKLHQKVYLLQEDLNTFLIPTISPGDKIIFPKIHALEKEILEKLAKDNLELIILLLLEMGDKSGYQILKDIANHFHCILSQGTLYPLLYKLEKENRITKQTGKGREVIYSLTQETINALKKKKENCLMAYQHLASFFEKRK